MADPIATIIGKSELPNCLKLDIDADHLKVFNIGFEPLIRATINACLEPIGIILKALKLISKPIEFIKLLDDIKPPNLPNLIVKFFNFELDEFPTINLGDLGIPAPFNVSIGRDASRSFDISQIPALGDFILSLLKIPFDIFTSIVGKLLTLNLNFDIPKLIGDALSGFSLIVDADLKINLPKTFATCMTKVLTGVFEPLTGGKVEEAKTQRNNEIKKESKNALIKFQDGNSNGAIKIIDEQMISPEDFKLYTGSTPFYKVVYIFSTFKAVLL